MPPHQHVPGHVGDLHLQHETGPGDAVALPMARPCACLECRRFSAPIERDLDAVGQPSRSGKQCHAALMTPTTSRRMAQASLPVTGRVVMAVVRSDIPANGRIADGGINLIDRPSDSKNER
jgi:hypothetical protein